MSTEPSTFQWQSALSRSEPGPTQSELSRQITEQVAENSTVLIFFPFSDHILMRDDTAGG